MKRTPKQSAEAVAKTIAELTDVKRTMPLIIKVCKKHKVPVDHILKVGSYMKFNT